MDLGTVGGLVVGGGLILVSILMGGGLGPFINVPSMMIVGGGALAFALIKYPLNSVTGIMGVVMKSVFPVSYSMNDEIIRFTDFAKVAKREGLLALEQKCQDLKEPFLEKALQLLVDGTAAEPLRAIMETEIDSIRERHSNGRGVLEAMATAAPAFGMIGTLIGLIMMLQELDDPSNIGVGMATALITTFYGVLLANLIFAPMAGKLEYRSKEELIIKEMMMEGVLSLQAGDSPYIVADKLRAFIARSQRVDEDHKGGKEVAKEE